VILITRYRARPHIVNIGIERNFIARDRTARCCVRPWRNERARAAAREGCPVARGRAEHNPHGQGVAPDNNGVAAFPRLAYPAVRDVGTGRTRTSAALRGPGAQTACCRRCRRPPYAVCAASGGSNLFHYCAYGLQIACEFECPELLPGSDRVDVLIRRAEVPQSLLREPDPAEPAAGAFQSVDDTVLLRIHGQAAFLIRGGREILVEPAAGTDADSWRIFLLGSAMGALLFQRGWLPIHGSGLRGEHGAFVITGEQGAGKSTLAAVLQRRGLEVLSDDVCAVDALGPEGPLLHPAYPRLHLREDVLAATGADPRRLRPSRKLIPKLALDVEDAFAREPARLRAIFLLQGDSEVMGHRELDPLERAAAVIESTYRGAFVRPMNLLESHFRQAVEVARHCRVVRIWRPRDLRDLERLAALVLDLQGSSPRT